MRGEGQYATRSRAPVGNIRCSVRKIVSRCPPGYERSKGEQAQLTCAVATHAITGHQVALKFINRAKITTADMNARVKREIQYLKVLRHPHIIKL